MNKKLKRMLVMPFMNRKRRQFLLANIMTPEQILKEEKDLHEAMIIANRMGRKEEEKEFMHKRDILRKILGIYDKTS